MKTKKCSIYYELNHKILGRNSNIFGDPAETLRDYKSVDVGREVSLFV
jgi:hypothetical protein